MTKNFYLICILSFLQLNLAKAQKVGNYNTQRPVLIYENKGQVVDQNRNVRKDVRMIFSAPGFTLVIKDQGMSYELVSSKIYQKQAKDTMLDIGIKNPKTEHLNDSVVFESHRIDIDFVNANPNPIIIKEGQSKYYENYYTEYTGEEGVTYIYGYTKTILKDVWKNIDIEFIADGKTTNSFKYNFIIRAGGNINDIQLKYNGATPVLLDNAIKITSTLGEISETIPSVYYTTHTSEKPEVNYILKDNIISFAGKNINTDYNTLVIDPSIVWASYLIGNYGESAEEISKGDSGYIYIGGITISTSGIATKGAYQTSFGGGNADWDGFLAKYSREGVLKWATYYGGNRSEYLRDISIDKSGNVYISGETGSSSGIATGGAYQTTLSGTIDVFLAKFTSAGSIKWSTYFGGSGLDRGEGGCIDDSGYLYIVGYTNSTSGIATSGTYQTSLAGSYDAFIAKFSNSNGNRLSATYYGGSNGDYANFINIDILGNLYVTGSTNSTSGIATSGAYQSSIAGDYDVFVAKFSNMDSLLWATYYGGSKQEGAVSLCIDDSSHIYITGNTYSDSGIASIGSHQINIAGKSDAFLANFSDSGSFIWGTYYGGDDYDFGSGLCVDTLNNIYITGTTYSSSGIATIGSYQSSYLGKSDGFLAKFSSFGNRHWASYFDGNKNGTESSRLITDDSLYVYATGYSQGNPGGNADAFLIKFSFNKSRNDAGLSSLFLHPDTICEGAKQVEVILKNVDIDTLKSDIIYWTLNGVAQHPTNWSGTLLSDSSTAIVSLGSYYFSAGYYSIIAWSVYPNGVKDSVSHNDTIQFYIYVDSLPIANAGIDITLCPGDTISIGSLPDTSMAYSWASNSGNFTDTSANPSVSPSQTTSYFLAVLNHITGCVGKDTMTVQIVPPSYTIEDSICPGDTYNFAGKKIINAGTYIDTIASNLGCSSIVTLNLKVLYKNSSTINAAICPGTYYSFGGNNIYYAGIYYDTLINIGGCDSVVTLNLSIIPSSTLTINSAICVGSIYLFSGKAIAASGIYYDTLKSITGCDSIITLNLLVNPLPSPIVIGNPTNFCKGDSVILSTGKYKSYLWNKVDTTPSIVVKNSGYYYVEVIDSNGCKNYSSPIEITVHANPIPIITRYNNDVQTGNYKTYQWYLNSNIITNANSQIYTPTVDGNYTVYVTDTNGCSGVSSLYNVGWTGISVYENQETIIYPNPTNGDVIMNFSSASNKILYIYDAWGRKVFDTKISDKTYKVSLNESYASGIYFFVLLQGEHYRIYKIVKG